MVVGPRSLPELLTLAASRFCLCQNKSAFYNHVGRSLSA